MAITRFKARVFRGPQQLVEFVNDYAQGAELKTVGNEFPMSNLAGKVLVLDISLDGGNTYIAALQRSHTFGAGPFNDIASIVSDLQGDAAFIGTPGTDFPILQIDNANDELIIRSPTEDPSNVIKLEASTNAVDKTPESGLLFYDAEQVAVGRGVTDIVHILEGNSGHLTVFYTE